MRAPSVTLPFVCPALAAVFLLGVDTAVAEPTPDLAGYGVLTVADIAPGSRLTREHQLDVARTLADSLAEAIGSADELGLDVRCGEPLGVAGELVLSGTVVKARRGSRAGRYFVGPFARASLVVDLELLDSASGTTVASGRVKKLWGWPGIAGTTRGLDSLVRHACKDVVGYLREGRRVAVSEERTGL